MVRSIIGMAHGLGLRVVAEGLETEAQVALLRDEGCDLFQGFYFGRPMAGDAIVPFSARDLSNGAPSDKG